MGKKLPTLEKRRRAVEATKQRFAGRSQVLGQADCIKMFKFHATQMGHKLPSTGHYSTVKEAIVQLKKHGAKNVTELLDKFLERIPPAAMLLGDVAVAPSDPDDPSAKLGTVVIKVAPTKYLGWHPDHELPAIMELMQLDAAWRL